MKKRLIVLTSLLTLFAFTTVIVISCKRNAVKTDIKPFDPKEYAITDTVYSDDTAIYTYTNFMLNNTMTPAQVGTLHNECMKYITNYPNQENIPIHNKIYIMSSIPRMIGLVDSNMFATADHILSIVDEYREDEDFDNFLDDLETSETINSTERSYYDFWLARLHQYTDEDISLSDLNYSLDSLSGQVEGEVSFDTDKKFRMKSTIAVLKNSVDFWEGSSSTVYKILPCADCLNSNKWRILAWDAMGVVLAAFIAITTPYNPGTWAIIMCCYATSFYAWEIMCGHYCVNHLFEGNVTCTTCPEGISYFDGQNCYYGSHPSGTGAFWWAGGFYYTSISPGHQCPVGKGGGGWYDGGNCIYCWYPEADYHPGLYLLGYFTDAKCPE